MILLVKAGVERSIYMREVRLTFCKGDLFAVAAVLMLSVIGMAVCLSWRTPSQDGVVQVYQDGELIEEYSLQKNLTFQVMGKYINTIEICDGKVAVVHSDCPGNDCVHSGWISSPGRSIVCLPNRLEIRISGAADVDIVVR